MNLRYDVCIIGGGAAGLAAAACLGGSVGTCILEKNTNPGRKLLATGGGRCNLTNAACRGAKETLDFFASLGLAVHCDAEGRYYPYSNCAADVVQVLTEEACRRGVEILCGFTAVRIDRIEQPARHHAGFIITAEDGRQVTCYQLLLATGGKAGPQFGTTGDGYRLAKSLGHAVTRVYPILTGISCRNMPDLRGVRARGTVVLLRDGQEIARDTGEIQFTADGISGICVFNITPYITARPGQSVVEAMRHYRLRLDLAPDFTSQELAGRASSFGILCRALSEVVSLEHIKSWELEVEAVKGWRHAQCSAGGVALAGIDPDTMESRTCPCLYFAGELLDLQGPCGGYNLQIAWESGRRAAAAMAARARQQADQEGGRDALSDQ